MTIADFKKQFDKSSGVIHFNNSGQAPIPDVNRRKALEWVEKFYKEAAFCSNQGWDEVEITRKKLAQFTGVSAEQVAFLQTTASGLSQAAFSIPFEVGDEIITWDQEYPSNFYPWRAAVEKYGAKIVTVSSESYETPVEKIIEKINSRTKAVAVSWVQYMTGAVTDLAAISKAAEGKNIWLVADVIQGLGVRPFNFEESGFDIICCGSHKWMCSSLGAGFMIVKKEKLNQMQPIEFGAMTYGTPDTKKSFEIPTRSTAAKFEPGSKAMIEIIAMGATIDLFTKVGIENIFKEACRLSDKLRSGLINLKLKVFLPHSGPIINFSAGNKEDDYKICDQLKKEGISYALRGPGIRLSLHGFNEDYEIEKALSVISSAVGVLK